MLVAALICLLFGIGGLLMAAGWRGRRLDDHPWCVKCGHDLFGAAAESSRCAECGADITRRWSTRRGHFRKRPPLIVFGALLLLASGSILGSKAWSWGRATEWEHHKPMWWLMQSVRSDSYAAREAALAELLRRIGLAEVSTERLALLAQMGLEYQADASTDWDPQWGSIVEGAIERELLTPEQIRAYLEGAVTFGLVAASGPFNSRSFDGGVVDRTGPTAGATTPPVFAPHRWDCIELSLSKQWNRAGKNRTSFLEAKGTVMAITVGSASLPESLYREYEREREIWMPLSRAYRFDETLVRSVPVVVEPGPHEIRASLQLECFARRDGESLLTLDLDLATPIDVQPPRADAIEIVTDSASSELLREMIQLEITGVRKIPTGVTAESTSPALICSLSTGESRSFGFRYTDSAVPFNASLDLVAFAGDEHIATLSVSVPGSSTYSWAKGIDASTLRLIVRPDLNSRSIGLYDRQTRKPKPLWMGPEFTVTIENVRWFDTIDDPGFPREHREMMQSFMEMWERRRQ